MTLCSQYLQQTMYIQMTPPR